MEHRLQERRLEERRSVRISPAATAEADSIRIDRLDWKTSSTRSRQTWRLVADASPWTRSSPRWWGKSQKPGFFGKAGFFLGQNPRYRAHPTGVVVNDLRQKSNLLKAGESRVSCSVR